MEELEIRKIHPGEIIELQEISKQTFSETFSNENTEENMLKYLDESFSLEKLMNEFNKENTEFYFATLFGKVIGYMKLNFGLSQTEIKEDKTLEIERIYTLKEFHGKQVGQMLLDTAMQVANRLGAEFIWLGVWEKNHRAISFYRKNGFVEFDKHIFKLGDDEQIDIMMKKYLDS